MRTMHDGYYAFIVSQMVRVAPFTTHLVRELTFVEATLASFVEATLASMADMGEATCMDDSVGTGELGQHARTPL
jgi:hypothetical protein